MDELKNDGRGTAIVASDHQKVPKPAKSHRTRRWQFSLRAVLEITACMAVSLAVIKMVPEGGALVVSAAGGFAGVLVATREGKTGGIIVVYVAVGGAAAGLFAAAITYVDQVLTQRVSYVSNSGTVRHVAEAILFKGVVVGLVGGAAIGAGVVSLLALAAKSVAAVIGFAGRIRPARSRNESLQEDTRHDS